MKKMLSFIAFMLIGMNALLAQSYDQLRPFWAERVPVVPAGANYFVNWGVGEGRNESEATNAAWADALQRSLHELGVVGITQQDINAVATNGINAVVKFNRMKRRIVTSTEPIRLSANRVKIYILVQVQRNVNGADDFYTLNTEYFRDRSFDSRMKSYNAQLTGRYPFSARVFVPGMAQLHKGSTAKGIFFIVAEVACVSGIVATECMRSSYASKAKSTHDANKIRTYIDKRDNCASVRNCFIAGAAAIYVWNVIDGIAAKGKKKAFAWGDTELRIAPYAAPQSGGLALSFHF